MKTDNSHTDYQRFKQACKACVERIAVGQGRREDFVQMDTITFDANPDWVLGMMEARSLHDEDYAVFGSFRMAMGWILDVGANWGYSVGSLRAAGTDCPILSFEVSPAFAPCLQRVKEVDCYRYEYVISGVGQGAPREHLFYIPTVNGMAIGALTTGTLNTLNEHMVNNIVNYVRTWRCEVTDPELKFLVVPFRINTIDNLLDGLRPRIDFDHVCAMKLDVEGLEGDALRGAQVLLARERPLLLIEGGIRNSDVRTILTDLGYVQIWRHGARLGTAPMAVETSNSFFFHPEKLAIYKEVGILSV